MQTYTQQLFEAPTSKLLEKHQDMFLVNVSGLERNDRMDVFVKITRIYVMLKCKY